MDVAKLMLSSNSSEVEMALCNHKDTQYYLVCFGKQKHQIQHLRFGITLDLRFSLASISQQALFPHKCKGFHPTKHPQSIF